MKTALDAVIEYKGDVSNVPVNGVQSEHVMLLCTRDNDVGKISFMGGSSIGFNRAYYLQACTYKEFNALVDELASNFGECDISYQKHCSNEVTRLEGDEMKTVTHEGKVYQIGATYEFTDSDKGRHWELGVLNDYANDIGACAGFQSKADNKVEWFKHIRLQQAPIGTITEAPVVLVDGECYQFDYPNKLVDSKHKGFYSKKEHRFVFNGGFVAAGSCVNIKPLTVA